MQLDDICAAIREQLKTYQSVEVSTDDLLACAYKTMDRLTALSCIVRHLKDEIPNHAVKISLNGTVIVGDNSHHGQGVIESVISMTVTWVTPQEVARRLGVSVVHKDVRKFMTKHVEEYVLSIPKLKEYAKTDIDEKFIQGIEKALSVYGEVSIVLTDEFLIKDTKDISFCDQAASQVPRELLIKLTRK